MIPRTRDSSTRGSLSIADSMWITAVDAKAAMASTVSRTPNVIVMDFSMPGMDGLSATRLLKRDPQTTHVPVIILTGHTHIVTAAAAREAGASVLAVKPCLPDMLEAEIRRLLAEGGGEFRYVRDAAASIGPVAAEVDQHAGGTHAHQDMDHRGADVIRDRVSGWRHDGPPLDSGVPPQPQHMGRIGDGAATPLDAGGGYASQL
jgi:CheY-like chemotaxis protein